MNLTSSNDVSIKELSDGIEYRRIRKFREQCYSNLYPSVPNPGDADEHDFFGSRIWYTEDENGQIESTMRYAVNVNNTLPSEQYFASDTDPLKLADRKCAEIGRFIIRHQHDQRLLREYHKRFYQQAISDGIETILIVVPQTRIELYCQRFGATVIHRNIGENYGSQSIFSSLRWDIADIKPAFFKFAGIKPSI